MAEGTRPKKELTVNFINSQYACLNAGVPGMTTEGIAAQLAHGSYFVYEGEVKGLVTKLQETDPQFDAKHYVQFLQEVNALRKGEAPAFGGGKISLNSEQTAVFVAKDSEDASQVKEIMRLATILVETRKAVNELLDDGVTCGIGFNSAARTKKRQAAETEVAEPTKDESAE